MLHATVGVSVKMTKHPTHKIL